MREMGHNGQIQFTQKNELLTKSEMKVNKSPPVKQFLIKGWLFKGYMYVRTYT